MYRCNCCDLNVETYPDKFVLIPDVAQGKKQLMVSEWHPELAGTDGAQYACGPDCATVLTAQFIAKVAEKAKALASRGAVSGEH